MTDIVTENNVKKRPLTSCDNETTATPITLEGEMPQKRFYRSRAHCNPLSHNDAFQYPRTPADMDWTQHYRNGKPPSVLDVGCGFGGLTVALATLLPDEHILGMEIRAKNWGRRIVSERLLTEYAYLLKEGGRLYCITDVLELHEWHVAKCNAHPLFEPILDCDDDPCVATMQTATEESQKVDRAGASKYYAVYRRIPNSQVVIPSNVDDFFPLHDHDENDDAEDAA